MSVLVINRTVILFSLHPILLLHRVDDRVHEHVVLELPRAMLVVGERFLLATASQAESIVEPLQAEQQHQTGGVQRDEGRVRQRGQGSTDYLAGPSQRHRRPGRRATCARDSHVRHVLGALPCQCRVQGDGGAAGADQCESHAER